MLISKYRDYQVEFFFLLVSVSSFSPKSLWQNRTWQLTFFSQKNKAYPLFPFSFLIHAFWSFLVGINITCFNLSVPRPPAHPSWAGNLNWLQQSSTPAGLVGIRSFFMVSLQISNGGNEGNYLPHFTVEACENDDLFCPGSKQINKWELENNLRIIFLSCSIVSSALALIIFHWA